MLRVRIVHAQHYFLLIRKMKKILYTIISIFILGGTLSAQNAKTIIEEINTPRSGQGNVKVYQDERIDGLLGQYQKVDSTAINDGNYIKVMGYKIQVYSGNNQSKSKAEAESKLSLIRKDFPEQEAGISYEAPTWLLRAGNFLTQEEAEAVLAEMKQKYPWFGREMYIVKAIVKRPSF